MTKKRYGDQNGKNGPEPSRTLRRVGLTTTDGGAPADWGSVDPAVLAWFVELMTRDDCAVRFGYSRDGGAYAIGIYGRGDTYTIYLSLREDVNEWLSRVGQESQAVD